MTEGRGYLTGQRRMIIARSIVGGLAGALPLPFLDDRALTWAVGSGFRRIAAAYQIELPYAAQQILLHGAASPASLVELAGGEIAYRIAGPVVRWAMMAFAATGRAQFTSRMFVTLTLFDHYCARLHTGAVIGADEPERGGRMIDADELERGGRMIDAATARALRDEIDRAIDLVPDSPELPPLRRRPPSAARSTGADLFLDRAIDALDRGWRVRLAAGIR